MRAEDRLRYEISKCRNCEACRSHVNFSCLVFPEMFRLVDKERETGEKITTDELMDLINLCNFCGACPCLDIRAAIMEAKTEYMDKSGLSFKIRAIENVERIGKWGGAIPQLTNFLFKNEITRGVLGKTVGIHGERKIPNFPKENFPEWIKSRKENIKSRAEGKKKVAYFAGCTARYLFPDVAKAVVEVLERNGMQVYYPEQQCCGMPSLLEGDRKLTLEFTRFNVDRLADLVEEGYDIVCSCPTCGYMLKNVLKIGAYYSKEYLEQVESDDDFVLIPVADGMLSVSAFARVPKRYLGAVLKDEGYFSSIKPKKRIMVAENTYDMGEYLRMLHERDELDTRLRSVPVRVVYYPPCHLREQRIGRPYEYLLSLIPGLSVDSIDGNYCCGNGGIMGFKEEFHHSSIKIASRLIAKIKSLTPDVLVTDCLSCRIQFNQLTPYKVLHPIQIVGESYSNYQEQIENKEI
ncbi:MAG: FeS-binding protein [Desulfobacteraceae bacterium]|nr:FeS-binding protein [Desulfobacteraceae bacterium]MBL7205315.1 FeS-binding protein [Desulfobacteraceae bacterium]